MRTRKATRYFSAEGALHAPSFFGENINVAQCGAGGGRRGLSPKFDKFPGKAGLGMASLNKVLLIGNLGRDPETRYMPDGGAITNVSIATTSQWKDKNGEKQEATEWHRVSFFGRLAEIAGEYLKKGSQVYVEGRIRTRKWTDKDGQEKYTTEIVADEMKMLGSRQGMGGGEEGRGGGDYARASGSGSGSPKAAPSKSAPAKFDDMDDDIPF